MKGIVLGIQKHPWKAFTNFFAGFSVQWTLFECITHFVKELDFSGILPLIIFIIVASVFTVVVNRRPSSCRFNIKHTNTEIEIKFSDIFIEDGFRAIAVNEFFDSEIGLPVSDKSLHGIFLSKCFGGHSHTFDAIIQKELDNISYEKVSRSQGKNIKYPIGATALVPVNTDRYLCFALCYTDNDTCKANADVPTLWRALKGLYGTARNFLGGAALVLPLVGSGLSGVGLPSRDLLDLIILSAISESKQRQVTTMIKIILTPDRFEEIDLKEVKKHWG